MALLPDIATKAHVKAAVHTLTWRFVWIAGGAYALLAAAIVLSR